MPRSRKYLSEYLSFTRKERVGIITVIVLILLFSFLPFFFPFFIRTKPADPAAFQKEIAALKIKEEDSTAIAGKKNDDGYDHAPYARPYERNYYDKKVKGELFYFDPNTLSGDGWKKLGIREKTISTIQNYISKGGRFYKPGDIARIWGLHEDEVERLLPYVRIEQQPAEALSVSKDPRSAKNYEKKEPVITVDINRADTSDFIALPGIGSRLANRIITFRDKLGGFYKIEQVAETYGLPDSTFQKIKGRLNLTDPSVKKININTATLDELKAHPYIRYHIASAIVQYRSQHGDFSSLAGLKNIMLITGDVYAKMEPYLRIH